MSPFTPHGAVAAKPLSTEQTRNAWLGDRTAGGAKHPNTVASASSPLAAPALTPALSSADWPSRSASSPGPLGLPPLCTDSGSLGFPKLLLPP